eukprot:TRINITY_DN7778_c0_g1_i7.p1 TRINITY_DN7778_c0_g1~~TRINITY_DN7778_c0_g1_i7.p1  ORF type:complete len:376 (-),score=79.78 TRINITY_DN7778_c0_g1_i7:62-1189(-)
MKPSVFVYVLSVCCFFLTVFLWTAENPAPVGSIPVTQAFLQTTRTHALSFCDARDMTLESTNLTMYEPHLTTKRGWKEMRANMPPMPYLDDLFQLQAPQILEIGCGSGHCMLDLQHMLPKAEVVGVNKVGYFYSQSWTSDDVIRTAAHYNVTLICTAPGEPKLPKILPTNGLQEELLDFPDGKFDFIYSQYALDWEKLFHWHSPIVIPRVSKVLKVGGTALLLVTFNSNSFTLKEFTPPDRFKANAFHLLDVHSFLHKRVTHSILVYTVQRSIGVGIRKCSFQKNLTWDSWGCFQDHSHMEKDTARWEALKNSLRTIDSRLPSRRSHMPKHEDYHGLYLFNLFNYVSSLQNDSKLIEETDLDKLLPDSQQAYPLF